MRIQKIHSRQLLDSRGNPTIEVEVLTNSSLGAAIVPSGASTGIHEAHELRDKTKDYAGKSVLKPIKLINTKLQQELKGMLIDDQKEIDEKLIKIDGTKNKSNLGSNAILGISMATTRAGALSHKMHLFEYLSALYDNTKLSLPIPFANIINGGVHAGNELNFQEFMIVPIKAKTFSEATKIVSETYQELKKILEKKYGKQATSIGDEGGFAPPIKTPDEAITLIETAALKAGHLKKVGIAIDVAASEFYKNKKYEPEKGKKLTSKQLIKYYESLIKKHNIISIEDPFDQDDFEAWKEFTKIFGKKLQIVGDDLTVTNKERINLAAKQNLCNALLLKINQIGTITEAMEAAHEAEISGWKIMVSHRSGETEDPYIADLAVALNAGQIKLGAPARGERTAKYNQLLRIEDYLGKKAKYAKWN